MSDSPLHADAIFSSISLCLEDAVATVTRRSQRGERDADREDVGAEQVVGVIDTLFVQIHTFDRGTFINKKVTNLIFSRDGAAAECTRNTNKNVPRSFIL